MWRRKIILFPQRIDTKKKGHDTFVAFFICPLKKLRYNFFMENKELKITDTVIGTGKETSRGALVIAHYEGFLEDGTKFDSSIDKGKPFQFVFGTGRVIKGWDQGLVGMKVGGKRTLFVPSELGYGERQIGQFIKPHSNLLFHVELLDVLTRD